MTARQSWQSRPAEPRGPKPDWQDRFPFANEQGPLQRFFKISTASGQFMYFCRFSRLFQVQHGREFVQEAVAAEMLDGPASGICPEALPEGRLFNQP